MLFSDTQIKLYIERIVYQIVPDGQTLVLRFEVWRNVLLFQAAEETFRILSAGEEKVGRELELEATE